jgi:hypothetical protein
VLDRSALKRRAAELAQEEWRRRDQAAKAALSTSTAAAAKALAAAASPVAADATGDAARPSRAGLSSSLGARASEPTGLGYLIQRPKLN